MYQKKGGCWGYADHWKRRGNHSSNRAKTARAAIAILAMATGVVALPRTAPATTYTWVQSAEADWSNMLNWSPNGVPGNGTGDVALITDSTGVRETAPYEESVPNSLASLTVNLSGGAPGLTNTLLLYYPGPGSTLVTLGSDVEYVGDSGSGGGGSGAISQLSGDNTVGSTLILGESAGDTGSYMLSSGSLLVTGSAAGDGEYVGYSGTGIFNQNSGLNVTLEGLFLGNATGSSGFYSLSGTGILWVGGNEDVGYSGTGTFNQTGGTNTGNVILGFSTGSSGTHNLSGTGTLSVTNGQSVSVGYNGTGTFNQSGGALSGAEYVGYNGTGTFNQTGGTNTPIGLILGYEAGSSGVYTLSGSGSLAVASGQFVSVGYSGMGTFNQTGGTNTGWDHLNLGVEAGSSGTYNLSGTGSLSGNQEYVGDSGTGTFNQTGGTNTAVTLYLALIGGGSGTYNLSGAGSLSVRAEIVGVSGTGTFNQTSGTNTTATLELGYNVSSGTYMLSGGSLLVTGTAAGDGEYVGGNSDNDLDTGTFNQTGGTNTASSLTLGSFDGSGTYTLGGTGSLSVTGGVYVGESYFGAPGSQLSVSGGQMTIGGTLEDWNSPGTQVTISGGSVSAGNTVNLATITQTGGTASLGALTGTGSISVGNSSGGSASMTVSALNQSSVTINATGTLQVTGGSANAVNTLTINGGQLDITNTQLFINYGSGPDPISSIAAWIASGYDGGAWNGAGIMSTNAQTNGGSYGIGYADSADPGNPANLPSGTIEIMYTLLGDANLDGKVNGTDFNILATNFNTGGDSWDQGDFTYDHKVNGSDFNVLAANFNQAATQAAVDLAALDSFAAANGISLANVPEPASAAMTVLAGLGILRRRRMSRQ